MLALSRWPIENTAWVGAPHAPQRLARIALAMPAGTVTLFATHWERDFFSINRLREAVYLARAIRAHVRGGGGPFALVGDFNATPWDFHLGKVLREFGLRHAARWTPTWPVGAGLLGAPIDHIVAPPGAIFERFERLERDFGSNHHGLRARLAFDPHAG
jgi:endonuclease/exonuclease/phosphatase (EEP) superfamily protein YafD